MAADQARSGSACPSCGYRPLAADLPFCPSCGSRVGDTARAPAQKRAFSAGGTGGTLELVQLDESGQELDRFSITQDETTLGRVEADISFPDDPFLSPLHAQLSLRNGSLYVRDLGSRNGTWFFLEEPHKLQDGDMLLIGSQIIRFRRLGYPGPNPPERDATRRLGSLTPSADIATMSQLRSDGSVRDVLHLSPGREVSIGRERGDWIFPYDPSMSGQHASVRSEDADFVIVDAGSRNGIAMAVRGEQKIREGSRVLIGDKLLKVAAT